VTNEPGEIEIEVRGRPGWRDIPNAFQVHRSNLHNLLLLFGLQDSVTSASGHTDNVQKFSAVDHMVVYSRSKLAGDPPKIV
jgi:hypothetical protein